MERPKLMNRGKVAPFGEKVTAESVERLRVYAEHLEQVCREAIDWLDSRPDYTEGDVATSSRLRAALAAQDSGPETSPSGPSSPGSETGSEGESFSGAGYPAGHPDTTGWSDLDDWDYMTTNSLIEGGWLPPDEAEKLRAEVERLKVAGPLLDRAEQGWADARADAEALAEALETLLVHVPNNHPAAAYKKDGYMALGRYRRGEHGSSGEGE